MFGTNGDLGKLVIVVHDVAQKHLGSCKALVTIGYIRRFQSRYVPAYTAQTRKSIPCIRCASSSRPRFS